jgi:hypothetical protein
MGVGDFVANPVVTYNQENSFGDSKQPAQKMEIAMVVHFAHFLHKQVNTTQNFVFGCRNTQRCPINASGDSWSRHKQVDVTNQN